MGRVSYELSEDNRRRLELLTAFGILNGHYPSRDEIVNESIRQYFMRVNLKRDGVRPAAVRMEFT